MHKIFKILLWVLGSILMILAVAFIAGYLLTGGDYTIAETAAQDPALPRIEINDTWLHAETFGRDTSQVVIVLHGGPGNDYRSLLSLQELADDFQVVFYDQRGSGLSERVPEEEISLAIFIEDLKAMVDHYSKDEKVFLIGHSWGGMLASAFIGRYPELIEKAVLAEPGFLTAEMGNELMGKTNYFQPPMNLKTIMQVLTIWLRSLHVRGPDEQARMDFFMEQLVFSTEIDNHPMAGYFCGHDIKNAYLPIWRMGTLASQTMQRSAMNEDGKIDMDFIVGVEAFDKKVLFIAGDCNVLIGPEYQARQMEFFPQAELVIIKDAGHSMIGEKPAETLKVIRDYFRE